MIAYFGQFNENYTSRFLATFSLDKSSVLISTKNGLAYTLGGFFSKLIRSQSYDRDLQRQRCKILQRDCIKA
jgi:hypothetical protein